MKRQSGFPGEAITEGLWLWLTLVTAIGLGTGATALWYTRGFSESSALTAGFIVMVVLFVLSETGYRIGWRPWKYRWWLNSNVRWALERRQSHKELDSLVRDLEATTSGGRGIRIAGSAQPSIEYDYRRFRERVDQLRKSWELQLDRDRDLLRKRAEQQAELLREIAQLSSDIVPLSSTGQTGEVLTKVRQLGSLFQRLSTMQKRKPKLVELMIDSAYLEDLLRFLGSSLESQRGVVEIVRHHLEQQRELVGEILKRSEDSEPG